MEIITHKYHLQIKKEAGLHYFWETQAVYNNLKEAKTSYNSLHSKYEKRLVHMTTISKQKAIIMSDKALKKEINQIIGKFIESGAKEPFTALNEIAKLIK